MTILEGIGYNYFHFDGKKMGSLERFNNLPRVTKPLSQSAKIQTLSKSTLNRLLLPTAETHHLITGPVDTETHVNPLSIRDSCFGTIISSCFLKRNYSRPLNWMGRGI